MTQTTDPVPNYVPVEQARTMPGLRIAFTQGLPGPWSVAARTIFDIKGIDYVAMPQEAGGPNEALKEWTGQSSAPVAMLGNERPRANWSEMLVLAEQLQPEPRLIPADEDERALMFGLCHEICGDDGLGWSLRLLMFSAQVAADPGQAQPIHAKYTSPVSETHSQDRLNAIIDMLGRRLERQQAAGSKYFIGNSLTAPDIYWAAFSNLFESLPEQLCVMPDFYRGLAPMVCAYLRAPLPKILVDHRDHVVRNHFNVLPIAF